MFETKFLTIAKNVEKVLYDIFDNYKSTFEDSIFNPLPKMEIVREVKDLTLRGGKRLRSAFVVAGYELFKKDGINNKDVMIYAAALELLQTYFLIHDDIMDADLTRRGKMSVHKSLEVKFNNEKTGVNLAILAGDYSSALSNMIMGQLEKNEHSLRAQRIFNRMHVEVICGQNFDLLNSDPYETVLRKSASYTTIAPLCIGAAFGGADEAALLKLSKLAKLAGIAFQYRDDLLGLFGNSEKIRKPLGRDLLNGKNTFIIKSALKKATIAQKKTIKTVFGHNNVNQKLVKKALEAIKESGAKKECENIINEYVTQSSDILIKSKKLTSNTDAVNFLKWLIARLASRSY